MTKIRVGQMVRYKADEPPYGHKRPRRGDIGTVCQMNIARTRAQLKGITKGALWCDADALEVISETDPFDKEPEALPEAKPERFEPAMKQERIVLPKAEPKPAPDVSDKIAPGSKMPEELAWPTLDGDPLKIEESVLVQAGGTRGGRPQMRTGHLIGCCMRKGRQCAIVSIGSAFKAVPIEEIALAPDQRLVMSKSIRAKLENFADGLTPEQRKQMLAIMRGLA